MRVVRKTRVVVFGCGSDFQASMTMKNQYLTVGPRTGPRNSTFINLADAFIYTYRTILPAKQKYHTKIIGHSVKFCLNQHVSAILGQNHKHLHFWQFNLRVTWASSQDPEPEQKSCQSFCACNKPIVILK